MHHKRSLFTKKKLLLGAGFLVVVLGVLLALELSGVTNFYQKKLANTDPQVEAPVINYGPATDEEKQQAEDNKKRLSSPQEGQTSSGSKQVKPVITSAGQFDNVQYGSAVEIRTLVTGIYEEGGTCTATLTFGSQKLERKVEALQDATTTRCDVFVIPRVEFPTAGSWDLMVNYTSSTATGNSDITKVEVK